MSSNLTGVRFCTAPNCHTPIPRDKHRCPSCKLWSLIPSVVEDEDTVLLSDARLEEVKRYSTGLVDVVFGGGIVTTSVSLVGGPPGAGKTTMFLQIADHVAQHTGREVLYIANEQSADEIKTTAKRIQVKNVGTIRIVKAMGGLRRDLGDILIQYKPVLVILDSLSNMANENLELAVVVAKRLKDYSVEYAFPTLLVNQINKEGDHAGLEKLQHAVDATFMLDMDNEDGSRFFYSTKNRFGQSPLGIELRMTPKEDAIPGRLMVVEKKEEL